MTDRPTPGPGSPSPAGPVRLNKLLAERGIASRRRSDELIAEGHVLVDGELVTELGVKVDPAVQRVEVDGVLIRPRRARRRYYLLNKPAGVLCTNEVREARPRAIDLVTDPKKGRIYPVGRLDEATVGLVILTDDGDFAQKITHPRYGVPKTYLVKVDGRVPEAALQKIREGIHLSEGRTSGARIVVKRRTDRQSTLLVTLTEGKNREVRRVFARVGWKVRSLRRTRIGPLTDRGIKVGSWRPLGTAEVRELLTFAEGGDEAVRRDKRGTRKRRRGPSRSFR